MATQKSAKDRVDVRIATGPNRDTLALRGLVDRQPMQFTLTYQHHKKKYMRQVEVTIKRMEYVDDDWSAEKPRFQPHRWELTGIVWYTNKKGERTSAYFREAFYHTGQREGRISFETLEEVLAIFNAA